MGVRLMNLASGVTVVALARNAESVADAAVVDDGGVETDDPDSGDTVETDDAVTFDDIADSDNEPGDTDV
jgi:uncharacterized protein YbjT (DUF2867 family)